MNLEEIFNEVYYKFVEGKYKVCLSTDRNKLINEDPPKMNSIDALQATVNYIIWEWSHDHEDYKFKKLIKQLAIPPIDYDLSKFSFTELLEVVSPELIKTSDIVPKKEATKKIKKKVKAKKPVIEKTSFENGEKEVEPEIVNGHVNVFSLFE